MVNSPSDLLLHEHPAAAGTAAECLVEMPLHLQRAGASGAAQDFARSLVYIIVSAEIAGIVQGGPFIEVTSQLQFTLFEQVGDELGVVHHLKIALELRVFALECIEAMRAGGNDFLHPIAVE